MDGIYQKKMSLFALPNPKTIHTAQEKNIDYMVSTTGFVQRVALIWTRDALTVNGLTLAA